MDDENEDLQVRDADNIDSFQSDTSEDDFDEDDNGGDPEESQLNKLNRYYGKFNAHIDPS